MFESLTDKLESAFKILKGQGFITDINVAETMKEVRKALLEADVNFKIAKDFTDAVKEKAMGRGVLKALSPGQLLIKIAHDELVHLMGSESAPESLKGNPAVILIAGLQGSGKTTFSGKLAHYLKTKKGRSPMLVAADIYRPAAIDQLIITGEKIGVPVYSDKENRDAVDIARSAVSRSKSAACDTIIIDTAGRMGIDEEMMDEISRIKKAVNPCETLFVVDSMTGQDAVNTAKAFNDRLDFDGVVLTKLDGDSRGGAALSIRSVVNKPVKFVGTGEKHEALDVFHPARMADRILGKGDVVTLVERAQEQFDEEKARKLHKKIAKNQFDFNDFIEQIQQIRKMGNVKDLLGMIPGVGKMVKNIDIKDDSFKRIEAIIHSMTPEERMMPKIINAGRRKRIADGSGTSITEVNKLIKQFEDTSKVMKMMGNKENLSKMMRNMPKMPDLGR